MKAEEAFAKGQSVRVYPHGDPGQIATGTVILVSSNQRSIAVAFEHLPSFAFRDGKDVAIHSDHGVMLLAMRVELNGVPWGPWVELGHGGHYEIEAIDAN